METIPLVTGFLWKLYDDYADNKEAYSFLNTFEFPLVMLVMGLSLAFAFYDNIFLIYIVITVVFDFIVYFLKKKDNTVKLNYAVDNYVWQIGGVLGILLFLSRFNAILDSLSLCEYALIGIAVAFIGLEIYSQLTKKKEILENEEENHLFLEASNQKFFTRFLELFVTMGFYFFVARKFESAFCFQNVLAFSFSYMYTSIISILYLKYFYFYLKDKDLFEK
jgi:hypothetical protein